MFPSKIPPLKLNSIEIPIKGTAQIIEIPIDDIPETSAEICEILTSEHASLDVFLRFAKFYFLRQDLSSYRQLLEIALQEKDGNTDQKALVAVLAHLGTLYIRNACLNKGDKKKWTELLEEATNKFNEADRLDSHDENTLLGKGILLMIKRNFDAAKYHFTLALERSPLNFVALNGLASLSYEQNEFKEALGYWRKMLKYFSFVPYFVRLGIALCLFQLERYREAEFAFKSTIDINPACIEAYIHLAQMERMKGTLTSCEQSIHYVKEGLKHEPKNPILLYELANHFFYLGDFVRCHALAYEAYGGAESDLCKARCCFLLGRNFHANSNFDEAFRYYLQAVKLDPLLICAQLSLSQCYIFRGEIVQAIEALERVLAANPSQYEALKMAAAIAHNNPKESSKLSKWVKSLVHLYPNDLEGLIIYAGLLETNDPQLALEVYLKCTKLLDNCEISVPADIWNNIAALLERTKHAEDALELFRSKIVSINSADFATQMDISPVEVVSEMVTTASEEQVPREHSNIDINQSNLESSLSATDPKSIILRFNFAVLLEKVGNTTEAISVYSAIIQTYPSYIPPYLKLANIRISLKEFSEAEKLLKEASQLDSSNVLIWYHYAYLYEVTKVSPSQQRKVFERVLSSINKHDLYSLLSIGNIYSRSARKAPSKKAHDSELAKAMEFYQKALNLESHSCYAANGIAICLQQKGHAKEAQEIFSQLKQNEIDFPDSWINLGHLHMSSNQYGTALNLYENAQHRFYQDKDPIVFMFMAKCLYCLGREESNFLYLDRAIACLEQARELESTDPLFHYNLAMCQEEFARLRLSLDTSKRSTSEIEKATLHIDSAITMFNQLVNDEEKGKQDDKRHKIYDSKVLKQRLESCLALRQDANALLQRQQNEEQLKQERIQQLKEIRMQHQQKEQSRLLEEATLKEEQEKLVQQQREALHEKMKLANQERASKPDEIDELFED